MWGQTWNNIFPIVAPFPKKKSGAVPKKILQEVSQSCIISKFYLSVSAFMYYWSKTFMRNFYFYKNYPKSISILERFLYIRMKIIFFKCNDILKK